MPQKAMKCIVEIDLHVMTCPGTFLRDYEYVFLNMEMLGLEARTKSVPPTFPLFFHERLRFERTFYNCTDPSLVANLLKGEDIIVELKQHTDYVTDGKVIAHCSSNTHDFLYPSIPPYYGSGREILLYKTSKFKPIRVTGEPVKLEFSTKTIIKEVTDTSAPSTDGVERITSEIKNAVKKAKQCNKSIKSCLKRSKSTPDVSSRRSDFIVGQSDKNIIANRNFSTYIRPKCRRSVSPTRSLPHSTERSSMRKSLSPSRGKTSVQPIPSWNYTRDFSRATTPGHYRSMTTPTLSNVSPVKSLEFALDDLHLTSKRNRYNLRHHGYGYISPNLSAALRSSDRIQRRVEDVMRKKDSLDMETDFESDCSLDVLRETLRDERNALNDAIKEADREAFYRSLNRTR